MRPISGIRAHHICSIGAIDVSLELRVILGNEGTVVLDWRPIRQHQSSGSWVERSMRPRLVVMPDVGMCFGGCYAPYCSTRRSIGIVRATDRCREIPFAPANAQEVPIWAVAVWKQKLRVFPEIGAHFNAYRRRGPRPTWLHRRRLPESSRYPSWVVQRGALARNSSSRDLPNAHPHQGSLSALLDRKSTRLNS